MSEKEPEVTEVTETTGVKKKKIYASLSTHVEFLNREIIRLKGLVGQSAAIMRGIYAKRPDIILKFKDRDGSLLMFARMLEESIAIREEPLEEEDE